VQFNIGRFFGFHFFLVLTAVWFTWIIFIASRSDSFVPMSLSYTRVLFLAYIPCVYFQLLP